jgi:hypothetical protein
MPSDEMSPPQSQGMQNEKQVDDKVLGIRNRAMKCAHGSSFSFNLKRTSNQHGNESTAH